jgi:hypothetical protein
VKTERYSQEARERTRRANYFRWLRKAEEKHPGKFSYKNSASKYRTQKKPEVPIYCEDHSLNFKISPFNHLRYPSGGCPDCEFDLRSQAKFEQSKKTFEEWYEKNRNRLDILGVFEAITKPIKFRCRIHRTEKSTTPSNLIHLKAWGCDGCSKEAQHQKQILDWHSVVEEFESALPDNVSLIRLQFDKEKRESFVQIKCVFHGEFGVSTAHLRRSKEKCPKCGNLNTGYSSDRMRRLLESGEEGMPTWVGVMEIQAFDILSLKVGVTTRTLEDRYKSDLKKIFFSTRLAEIDALVLENQISREFSEHQDLRILKAGMRIGNRWSGDTELFWFNQRESIIDFIKKFIRELEREQPDYWKEYYDRESPKYFERDVSREKDLSNRPQIIVGIDPDSNAVACFYPSISAACRERNISHDSISSVLRGERNIADGLRWFLRKDFSPENVPPPIPLRNSKPVRCVQTGAIYPSATIASYYVGQSITTHIREVCKGYREEAGGYQWEYVDISVVQAVKLGVQSGLEFKKLPTKLVHRNAKPVRCIETNRLFVSVTEASRATGIGHIYSVCNGQRPSAGGYTWEYIDLTVEEVLAQESSEIVQAGPVVQSNAKCPIEAIDPNTGEVIGVYPSIQEAQRAFGVSNINRVLKGAQPLAGGLFWRRQG